MPEILEDVAGGLGGTASGYTLNKVLNVFNINAPIQGFYPKFGVDSVIGFTTFGVFTIYGVMKRTSMRWMIIFGIGGLLGTYGGDATS